MASCNLKRPINSICRLVTLTEQLLSALKGDETCVSRNESHLAGLSRAVCDPVIRTYIDGA